MLGEPIAAVAEALGQLHELDRVAQGAGHGGPRADRDQIEDAEGDAGARSWRHAPTAARVRRAERGEGSPR